MEQTAPEISKKKGETDTKLPKDAKAKTPGKGVFDTSSTVTFRIDSQLQNDMQGNKPLNVGTGQIAALFDNNTSLSQVYFISSSGISNAYQSDDTWIVEDTAFPNGSSTSTVSAKKHAKKRGAVSEQKPAKVEETKVEEKAPPKAEGKSTLSKSTGDSKISKIPKPPKKNSLATTTSTPVALTSCGLSSKDGYIFAIDNGNKLWMVDERYKWLKWASLGSLSSNNIPGNVMDIRSCIVENDISNPTDPLPNISVVITNGSSHKLYVVVPWQGSGDWVLDQNSSYVGAVYDYQVDPVFAITTQGSKWGYFIAASIQGADALAIIPYGSLTAKIYTVSANKKYIAVAFVLAAIENDTHLFAIDTNKQLWYFQPTAFDSLGNANAWTPVQLTPPTGTQINIVSLKAASRVSPVDNFSYPEVLGVDTSGNGWHFVAKTLTQFASGGDTTQHRIVSEWRRPAMIMQSVGSVDVQPAGGGPEYFVASPAGTLALWNINTETGEWENDNVELPNPGEANIQNVQCYYVELDAKDENQIPLSNASVELTAAAYVQVEVNSRFVTIDPCRPVYTSLSQAGKLSIVSIVNGKLGVPTFSFNIAGMDPEDIVDIEPGGGVQVTMKTLTETQLSTAKNNQTETPTQNIVPSQFNNTQTLTPIAAAINEAAGYIDSHPTAQSRKYLHKKTGALVAKCRKRSDPHSNILKVDPTNNHGFRINFEELQKTKKDPKYKPKGALIKFTKFSSKQEAATHVSKQKADVQGFFDFDWSWGDLVDAIESGFAAVVDAIVAVADAITATITVIVDGISQIWEGVVNFVSQVMDVIGTVLDQIQVFFQQIFEWLAFFFDFSNYKQTKEFLLDAMTNKFPAYLTNMVTVIGPKITDQLFTQAENLVNNSFNALTTLMNGRDLGDPESTGSGANSLKGIKDQDGDDVSLDSLPSSAMWLLNKIIDIITGGGVNITGIVDTFEQLMDTLINGVTSIAQSPQWTAFVQALNTFFGGFTTRSGFDSTTINSFLNVIKTGILFLITVAKQTVLTSLQLASIGISIVTGLLNASIYIPIVTDIFEYLTGESSTVGNIVCYVFAIPLTILWKIMYNENFPNQWPTTETKSAKSGKDVGTPTTLTIPQKLYIAAACVKLVSMPIVIINDVISMLEEFVPASMLNKGRINIFKGINILLSAAQVAFGFSYSPFPDDVDPNLDIGYTVICGYPGLIVIMDGINAYLGSKGLEYFNIGLNGLFLAYSVAFTIWGATLGYGTTSQVLVYCDNIMSPIEPLTKFVLRQTKNPYAYIAIPIVSAAFSVIIFALKIASINALPPSSTTLQIEGKGKSKSKKDEKKKEKAPKEKKEKKVKVEKEKKDKKKV